MSDPSTFTFKKSHIYLTALAALSIFALLLFKQGSNPPSSATENPSPAPTETIYVPTQGNNWRSSDDSESQLRELREQNCRLSQDLMLQSLDLSRQANDLEWASDGIDNFDQIQSLRNQSIDLLIKSQELANDC